MDVRLFGRMPINRLGVGVNFIKLFLFFDEKAAAWAKIAQPRRYSGTRCSFRAANLAEQMVLWVTGGRSSKAAVRGMATRTSLCLSRGYAYGP